MDSGATSSATFDESDCDNVRDCDVRVTAAGSEFTVTKMGTARITALDERGKEQKILGSNCLISPLFPCKLLSLSALTKKGLTATMTGTECASPTQGRTSCWLAFVTQHLNFSCCKKLRRSSSVHSKSSSTLHCSPNLTRRATGQSWISCGSCTSAMDIGTLRIWHVSTTFPYQSKHPHAPPA